jgi:hypothetical protein
LLTRKLAVREEVFESSGGTVQVRTAMFCDASPLALSVPQQGYFVPLQLTYIFVYTPDKRFWVGFPDLPSNFDPFVGAEFVRYDFGGESPGRPEHSLAWTHTTIYYKF